MEDKFTIKPITAIQLKNSYEKNGESPFVGGIIMITTPTCTKCKAILKDEEKLRELLPIGMFLYEYNDEEDGMKVLMDMKLSSVPIMLYVNTFDDLRHFRTISNIKDLENFLVSLDSL